MNCNTPRPRRVYVLIVAHPDGHIEVFAESHVSVRISRLPVAHSREAERTSEDCLELSLPLYYQQLYFPGYRRATATLTPLKPSTFARAKAIKGCIGELNNLLATSKVNGSEGVAKWTTL